MPQEMQKNGHLELRYNEERTQVMLTVYPPMWDGEAVTGADVMERLRGIGVTYGVKEQAILDAVHYAENTNMVAVNVVVAQGVLPVDGTDAAVHYSIPADVLSIPLPKRPDRSEKTDWFSLDPRKMVASETLLASIVPPQDGTAGKTLTSPIQSVAPRVGKPALLSAGSGVRTSEGGLRLLADCEGYAVLYGDQLQVHPMRVTDADVTGVCCKFPGGAVFRCNVDTVTIRAGGVVAIQKRVLNSNIRAHADVYLNSAEQTRIVTSGDVYVSGNLLNCEVVTRRRVIASGEASIVGGCIYAGEGVSVATLGASDFTATEVHVGTDRLAELRAVEIQEELAACEMNSARISQALKPFVTMSAHANMNDDKRRLLTTLQGQQKSLEVRTRELHNERRTLSISSKEKINGSVTVLQVVHPGVWIGIAGAATQIETVLERTQFVEGAGGKSVQAIPLRHAA